MRFALLAWKCYRILWRLWILGLLVTLIVPATREAHICSLRAFFHLSRGQTTVSRGGHTWFTEEYRQRRIAAAGNSPDDYLLATCVTCLPKAFPPAPAWASDPLLPWAAIASAARTAWAERIADEGPLSPSDLRVDQCSRATLELVQLARPIEPDNGLIWLAEALAYFARCQDEPALAALEGALRRTWDDHGEAVSSRKQRLLETAGMPAFDATMPNVSGRRDLLLALPWHAREHLVRLLVRAVRCGDDAAFVHYLELLRDLRDVAGPKRMAIVDVAHRNEELIESMAAGLAITLPPDDSGSEPAFKARFNAEEDVWKSYLRLHAPTLAEAIVSDDLQRKLEREQHSSPRACPELDTLFPLAKAELMQQLSLLMIGAFLAGLIAGLLAWVWPPEWPDGKKLRLRRGFLLAMIPAYALMICCIWAATRSLGDSESICGLVISDPARRPLLTDAQKDLLFSAAAAALPLLVLTAGPAGRTVYRAGLLLNAYLYFAAIIAAAVFRQATVEALSALVI